LARRHGSVLLITKGSLKDCNSRLAQGGVAAAIGLGDSPEIHLRDTVKAGAGLCDESAVRILVEEAADRIADLVELGVEFDTVDGKIALTLEAAHSMPRILHAGGDATGARIEDALSQLVLKSPIELQEESLATGLLVENGQAKGIQVLDNRQGVTREFSGRYIILATGGAGQLYRLTTNPAVATGDGIALAYFAGARAMDLEFFQFHPTALCLHGASPFLISEAVRGEGGILLNQAGRRFMPDYASQAELAPRDIVARAIVREMAKTGADNVYLDVRHLTAKRIAARFPQIYRFCLDNGLDITRELIPVSPVAHYMIGGIEVNYLGETSLRNLFVTGEAACTGVHGANRLASNSLMEVLVYSRRIVDYTLGKIRPNDPRPDKKVELHRLSADLKAAGDVGEPTLERLQNLMWHNAGILRNQQGLEEARQKLAGWQKMLGQPHNKQTFELRNLILTARLLVEGAYPEKGKPWCAL
jgi:L-aspartate oxidase